MFADRRVWSGGFVFAFVLACSEGTGVDETADACEYGQGQMCECPGGGGSVAWCLPDQTGYGPCECEGGEEGFADEVGGSTSESSGSEDASSSEASGETTSETDTSGETTSESDTASEGGEGKGTQVCFLGPDADGSACFPIVMPDALPDGYDYPEPYQGNTNYRAPICYLDLEAIDAFASIAPNFTLDEFAQAYKGRYAVVQPHAVERVQQLRDELGPIIVNSGYRPPAYNAMIGGATYSRHMYGDAFDLDAGDVSLATLQAACTANAGFLVEYEAHVHCDWRNLPVDVDFFGLPGALPEPELAPFASALEHDAAANEWRAPASGFDEGEPARRWSAWDAQGQLLADEVRTRSFAAPPGSVRIEVVVGAQLVRAAELVARP